MSERFTCDDKDMLVAYLYGEIDLDGRREVDRHLRTCAACAQEVESLQVVRDELQAWQPPAADLGFTIVQQPAAVLQPRRWWSSPQASPWTRAAAAVLVLAAGAAIANVRVQYGRDGLAISTGWMAQPQMTSAGQGATPVMVPATVPGVSSSGAPVMAVAPAPASEENWRLALRDLEQTLRQEIADARRDERAGAIPVAAPADNVVWQRVETALEASEQRQREELARRFAQFNRDIEMRRSADMIRLNQDFDNRLVRSVNLMRRASLPIQ